MYFSDPYFYYLEDFKHFWMRCVLWEFFIIVNKKTMENISQFRFGWCNIDGQLPGILKSKLQVFCSHCISSWTAIRYHKLSFLTQGAFCSCLGNDSNSCTKTSHLQDQCFPLQKQAYNSCGTQWVHVGVLRQTEDEVISGWLKKSASQLRKWLGECNFSWQNLHWKQRFSLSVCSKGDDRIGLAQTL